MLSPCLLALGLLSFLTISALAQSAGTAGTFLEVGDTLVSAMMMFLGNSDKVYILDKVENNPTQINGDHPAWGSVWDIASKTAIPMEVITNTFCAAGMHLPNGSFVVFGGNPAVGPGGANSKNKTAPDPVYGDRDGRTNIRMIQPCLGDSSGFGQQCQWVDEEPYLKMQAERWYPGTEALADGTVIIIGGSKSGGYVNRNAPGTSNPLTEDGGASPSYEYYPSQGLARNFSFLGTTEGLNMYAHTYLMPSGKLFVQAKFSTTLWDHVNNVQEDLPDMPNNTARVYPASGATAMLPLTPANNYTPTILFCGGMSSMADDDYGDFTSPYVNTWEIPASSDCQRITPEPQDGSQPAYEQDDDMPQARTMGQFIILPTGKLLVINGGLNGTAGYAPGGVQKNKTVITSLADMPYGPSLGAGPVFTPAIYDPTAPPGQRWSTEGLSASKIPRMYHSGALLLPDGSVIVAGSNPNLDYNTTVFFPTEYRAEYFYPPYFGQQRPNVSGVPDTFAYGGSPFSITISPSSYSGSSNTAAQDATAVLIRPGFTTHAMNMGQRFLQLNNTFSVGSDGTITLHVSQLPTNAALFQPGPCLFFVVVNGIPSIGTMVTIGNGQIGTQPVSAVVELPPSVLASSSVAGTAATSSSKPWPIWQIIAVSVGGAAVLAAICILGICCISQRRRASSTKRTPPLKGSPTISGPISRSTGYDPYPSESRTAFIPMNDYASPRKMYNDADNNKSWYADNPSKQEVYSGADFQPPMYDDRGHLAQSEPSFQSFQDDDDSHQYAGYYSHNQQHVQPQQQQYVQPQYGQPQHVQPQHVQQQAARYQDDGRGYRTDYNEQPSSGNQGHRGYEQYGGRRY